MNKALRYCKNFNHLSARHLRKKLIRSKKRQNTIVELGLGLGLGLQVGG